MRVKSIPAHARVQRSRRPDEASLLETLRATGVPVEPLGTVPRPFFSVAGQTLSVAGAEVQTFEFGDEPGAAAAAGRLSPGGDAVDDSLVKWKATPHFFQADRVTMLYVGEAAGTLARLTAVLGPAFAEGGAAL